MTVKDAIERAQNDARISSVEVTEQREQCERAQTLPSRDGTRCNQREHARPTVKDIFALRKQGKIEEAYEAIRPIYREHKGKYFAMKSKTAPASSVLASSAGEAGSPAYSAFRASPAATVPAGSPAVPSAQVPVPSPALSGSPAYSAFRGSPAATVPAGSPAGLNPGQRAVLDYIRENPGLRVPMISEGTNIPSKSIERHISVLIERGLIEHRGSKKTGGYYANNQ